MAIVLSFHAHTCTHTQHARTHFRTRTSPTNIDSIEIRGKERNLVVGKRRGTREVGGSSRLVGRRIAPGFLMSTGLIRWRPKEPAIVPMNGSRWRYVMLFVWISFYRMAPAQVNAFLTGLQGSFPSLYEGIPTFHFCCSDTWYQFN